LRRETLFRPLGARSDFCAEQETSDRQSVLRGAGPTALTKNASFSIARSLRDLYGRSARKWQLLRCSNDGVPECPSQRFEQVPRRPGRKNKHGHCRPRMSQSSWLAPRGFPGLSVAAKSPARSSSRAPERLVGKVLPSWRDEAGQGLSAVVLRQFSAHCFMVRVRWFLRSLDQHPFVRSEMTIPSSDLPPAGAARAAVRMPPRTRRQRRVPGAQRP